MRAIALVAWAVVAVVGCGGQRSAPATAAQPHVRCVLRLSAGGMFVDGERASREDAIAQCKRTSGAIVVIEGGAPSGAWDATRAALEHEGVWFYVRGPICHGLYRESCGPKDPVLTTVDAHRVRVNAGTSPKPIEVLPPKPVPVQASPSSP